MHEDLERLQMAIHHNNDRIVDLQGDIGDLKVQFSPLQMQQAISGAIREVLADPKATKEFWKAGFDELTSHAGNGAAQWVGKRLIAVFLAALLAGSIVWMVKTGKLTA